MRYGRACNNLDRHPNYILAAYMASGTLDGASGRAGPGRRHEQVRSGLTAGLVASVTAAIAIPVPATIDRIKPVRPLDRRAMLVSGR
jgi:hypothetical protein